jgi:hypothetical protein
VSAAPTVNGPLTAGELLSEARSLLEKPTREAISGWPRAVALLARMALESSLDTYWRAWVPGVQALDMRAQLGCARGYLGPALAGEISYAWSGLSHATHHRPYELDPTVEELRALLLLVERALDAIALATGSTA